MYGYLFGKIKYIDSINKELCLLAGGVGYVVKSAALHIELNESSEVGIFVYTHVTDSGITLWGFDSKEALQLFRLLITVSGIGPSSAQAILAQRSPAEVVMRVLDGDHKGLRVGGIGEKGAQKIVLELQSKIAKLAIHSVEQHLPSRNIDEAVATLVSLGFARKDVQSFFMQADTEQLDTAGLVKHYLKSIHG